MGTLLDLRIDIATNHTPKSGYGRFAAIAQELGLEISPILISEEKIRSANRDQIVDVIAEAHGFWIQHPHLLSDDVIRGLVRDRLRDGALAIANLNWNVVPGAEFFQELGMEATPVRASRPFRNQSDTDMHPMLVPLDRSTHAHCFRDATLFKGVTQLLLQQANGIGCVGDAQAVLALPSESIELTDMRTDYGVNNFPRPDLPVIVSAASPGWRGRVIGMNTSFFHDSYRGPLGDSFPGIAALDNERAARNILECIASGKEAYVESWEEVFRLIDGIERTVARVTARLLQESAGAEWFTFLVPEKIRSKCTQRQEHERSGFPVAAYIDLIDYKLIWKENWSIFQPILVKAALPDSKSEGLRFMQDVNDLRKLSMHPTKRLHANLLRPARDDIKLLEKYQELVNEIDAVCRQNRP